MTVADTLEALADAVASGTYVMQHDDYAALARVNAVVAAKVRGGRDYSPELVGRFLKAQAAKAKKKTTLFTDRH